jgi:serine O-acetyltransferase
VSANDRGSTGPGPTGEVAVANVVDALCRDAQALARRSRDEQGRLVLPSREAVVAIVEALRSVLFPGYFGMPDLHDESLHFYVGATLDGALKSLEEQVQRALCFASEHPLGCRHCADGARQTTRAFLERLPEVRRLLATDVEAAYEGDPALRSPDEAIFCYPGVLAITSARIAHELFVLGAPLIPRIITEHAHSQTGIDIHPGARIGERFFIDHGTGVVIGETSVLGRNVRLYQGVTLGAKSFPLDEHGNPIKGIDRHPVLEDDVIIYSGATILGRVTIGKGSTIGGNVWLTFSVPPGTRVTQAHSRDGRFEGGAGI